MEYSESKSVRDARCLECGDEISYGRTDKKFCSETCKNRYHNKRTRSARAARIRTLNALEKNHTILDGLLERGITEIGLMELRQLGFSTDHVTCYRKCGHHDEYCCFDIMYRMTASRISRIARLPSFIGCFEEKNK